MTKAQRKIRKRLLDPQYLIPPWSDLHRHAGHSVMSRSVSRVYLRARNLRSMFQHGMPSRGKKWGQPGERRYPILHLIHQRFRQPTLSYDTTRLPPWLYNQ